MEVKVRGLNWKREAGRVAKSRKGKVCEGMLRVETRGEKVRLCDEEEK